MPKLTDEEVGQLLRETFADKEILVDQLPKATTGPVRRKASVLLAAAAVAAVLTGTISLAANDARQADQPAQTTQTDPAVRRLSGTPKPYVPRSLPTGGPSTVPVGEVAERLNPTLTALAIAELTKWEQPAGGWPVVNVLEAPYQSASSPLASGPAGTPFTAAERSTIEGAAGVPIEWVKSRPAVADPCTLSSGTPYVTVSPITFAKGAASATIGMSMWRGCLDAQWLTYRLTKDSADKWQVAGTVGPVAMS